MVEFLIFFFLLILKHHHPTVVPNILPETNSHHHRHQHLLQPLLLLKATQKNDYFFSQLFVSFSFSFGFKRAQPWKAFLFFSPNKNKLKYLIFLQILTLIICRLRKKGFRENYGLNYFCSARPYYSCG